MNERLRQRLCELVAEYGPGLADDPGRCRSLLQNAVGDEKAVDALMRALTVRVPAQLALVTEAVALQPLLSSLAARLVAEQGLNDHLAHWAVESWAMALGKTSKFTSSYDTNYLHHDHTLAPPRGRRKWALIGGLTALLVCAGLLWWAGQRVEIARLVADGSGFRSLALIPDGGQAISGGVDKKIRIWDLKTGQTVRILEGHEGRVGRLALAPDGKQLLSCGGLYEEKSGRLTAIDCMVRLWDVQSEAPPKTILSTEVPLFGIAFHPDGKQAVTCGGGYEIRDVKFLERDGKHVPHDCCIWLFDLETKREVRRFVGHRAPVYSVVLTPDGSTLISASSDDSVRFWDVASGKEKRALALPGKTEFVYLALSPDGRLLAVGHSDSRVRLWDLEHLDSPPFSWAAHAGGVRALAFSSDGRRLLTGGEDYVVRLWNLDDGTEQRHYLGHDRPITSVAFRSLSEAISASHDGTIRLWRLPKAKPTP